MDSVAVFILVIVQASSFQYDRDCNVYTPEIETAVSDMDDLQQLQYCLIDNCTILRIDTKQRLGITYSTQTHLMVTSIDGQTSLLILRNKTERLCYPDSLIRVVVFGIGAVLLIFTAIVSGCTVVEFLLFKELRTTFGKLLMLFNIGRTFHSITIMILLSTTNLITVNSKILCYIFWFSFLQASMITEESTTCVIGFLAYLMHSSYKSIEVKRETKKRLFKYSVVYIFGLPLLFQFLMITYDVATGMYHYVILPNGHCSFVPTPPYTTSSIGYANIFFNRVLQIILVIAYFTYYYKLQNALKFIRSIATSNKQKDRLYLKLGVAMAATMGVSKFFYVLDAFIEHSDWLLLIGTLFLLLQQALIMILLTCSKKMARLCKERFCTTETSP